jgi:16S rRNA (cytidine1402-2'-O)-methyltransferase
MAAVFGDREAAIGRELTKLFEEFRRDRLPALAAALAAEDQPRGELVVMIGPPAPREGLSDAAIAAGEADAALRAALATLPTREAAQRVAAETGAARRALYQRALQLKDG